MRVSQHTAAAAASQCVRPHIHKHTLSHVLCLPPAPPLAFPPSVHQVDRASTPWVIVAVHAPFYHTYLGHYKEAECMRQAYEPLLVEHGVDIVLSGHVHAYERTKPLVNYQVGGWL